MSNDTSRVEFEACFKAKIHFSLDRNMPDKSYNDPAAHIAWSAWQASRRAAIEEALSVIQNTISTCTNAVDGLDEIEEKIKRLLK